MISLPFVFPLDVYSGDGRGVLSCVPDELGFTPKRVFTISSVPASSDRGNHAHKRQDQIILCPAGYFCVDAWGSTCRYFNEFKMDASSDIGFYLPSMVYIRLHTFSPDGVAVVLSDGVYDPNEVIDGG